MLAISRLAPLPQPKCRITLSTNFSITQSVWTKLEWDTVVFDIGCNYDTELFRYIIPQNGTYFAMFNGSFFTMSAGAGLQGVLKKNNTLDFGYDMLKEPQAPDVCDCVNVLGVEQFCKDDYIECFVKHTTAGVRSLQATTIEAGFIVNKLF